MESVENARALLKNKIEEVLAKSVLDLIPDKNSDVAFEIEFQDQNQKPIKCRCRPLPWNMKEKSLWEEQEKDEDIQWIKGLILENGAEIRKSQFLKAQHVVWFQNNATRLTKTNSRPNCQPSSQHNLQLSFRKIKTMSKITDRFYRPFLKDDIMRCVKCCDVCQNIKLTQPVRHAELIYLTPCRSNQLITTDLAGPYPTNSCTEQQLNPASCK
ncbi:hypothetical protein BpHYR1_034098 [Brachionus plicatilis]|uniref:Integrase zinc-binding domain-containing protein n=1 Tax=Brachionus plicatilis TaxID=10195 RepID=A0A3M7PJZ0_BRAPC|nr:hypothetical protein BpHYR1_034098 [Brachionus plicatilis]